MNTCENCKNCTYCEPVDMFICDATGRYVWDFSSTCINYQKEIQ